MSLEKLAQFIEEIPASGSIPELFLKIAELIPERSAYSQALIAEDGGRSWYTESYRDVAKRIYRLARLLVQQGIAPGDRVAILSFTRPEWMIADLAILFVGATSVSIYHSLNVEETGYILFDAGVKAIFIENEEQLSKLHSLARSPITIPATEERAECQTTVAVDCIISFERVTGDSRVLQLADILADESIEASPLRPPPPADYASIVYTSGTSGPPKGVLQTHRNHLTNLWQACRTKLFAPNGDIFLFLPLAHSFARLIGYIGFLTPTEIKFPAVTDRKSSVLNAPSILRDLREGQAQVVPMVPRIIEKVMAGVNERMKSGGMLARLLALTIAARRKVYDAQSAGLRPPLTAYLIAFLTAPIAAKVRKGIFGRAFQHIVSGGARLAPDVNHFFHALGVAIYEGYGLTETCVATNVNRIGNNKIGSVGPCLDGIEVKIAGDGEILFRGANVAVGYLGRRKLTAEAWDTDGWFHTGDLGYLDSDGYLFIDGRKKDLLVTSGGKKIAPQGIEERLAQYALISGAVVVGDGRPYCIVLLVPERTEVAKWAARTNLTLPEKLSDSAELHAEFLRIVTEVNAQLSKFETLKRFAIVDGELSVENGLLTPTFKIKRALVAKRYAELIEQVYRASL